MVLASAILGATLIEKHYSDAQSNHVPDKIPSSVVMLLEGIWTIALLVFYLSNTGDIKDVYKHIKNISWKGAGYLIIIATLGIFAGLWLEKESSSHSELSVIALTLLVTIGVESYLIINSYKGKNMHTIIILAATAFLAWSGVYLLLPSKTSS